MHSDHITVTDGSASSQSAAFSRSGPFAKFVIRVPTSATTGSPATITIYAEDSAGNLAKGYSSSTHWTDTSGQISGHPAAFSAGKSTNTITFTQPFTADRVQVTAGSVTGRSATFNIN